MTLTVQLKKVGLDWLEGIGAANGMSAGEILTLLCDVGRNVIDRDPLHPEVIGTLAAAGFYGFVASDYSGHIRWMCDDLPF